MERERSAIIELFVKGNNPGEILKLLKMPKQGRKLIYRTIQRYKKTGGVKDMPRSGRPKSVTTPRLKKVVMDRIRRNPRRSLRKMAVELKVSRGSLQNLVRNDIGLRSFKRKKVYFLSKQIREKGSQEVKFFSIGSQIRVSSGLYSQMRNYLQLKRRQTSKTIGY